MKKTSTEYDRMKAALQKKEGASFGRAQQYAPGPNQGGPVIDEQGSGTTDTVPTVLASGEYVLPADTVEQVGVEKLEALKNATHKPLKNGGKVKFGCADGGVIQAIRNRPRRIDVAEEAAVNNTPMPAEPRAKSIEQQTKEKVLQPAQDFLNAGKGVVDRVKKAFGMAEGGVVGTLKNRRDQIEAAVNSAAGATPVSTPAAAAPAAPAPATPVSSLDAQVAAQQAAARAAAQAENAKPKGLFGRARAALGMADGGWVYKNGRIDTEQEGSWSSADMQRSGGYEQFAAQPSAWEKLQSEPGGWDKLQNPALAQPPAAQPARPAQQPRFGMQPMMGRGRGIQPLFMTGGGKVPKFDEFGRPVLNDAVSGPGAARPPGYTVQELPVEEIDYSKTRNPGQSNLGQTVEKFGSKPAQAIDPARTAGNAVADARAAANNPVKPPAAAEAAKRGLFGRVAGAASVGIPAALHSADVGVDSDIVPTATRPGAFNITPEAAALSDTAKYNLMAELNNPRTHPDRQAQIRELMIGKTPVAADASPRQKSDFGNPTPVAAPAAAAPATPAAPTGPTPAQTNDANKRGALVDMGIDVSDLDRPAVPQNMRGDIVRNTRGMTPGAAVNLGSYGVEGQQVFGRSNRPDGKMNDFVGVGNGARPGGYGGSRGVDLGIKPGEVEQFKRDLNLGPRPDAFRNPVAYKAWQDSKAQQDQVAAQGQASMVKAQADFYKAISDGNKDAATAAAARAEAEAKRAAENAKGLDELAANFANQGYFGDADPKQAEAVLKTIIATKPLKLKDGRTVLFKDLSDRERADHVGPLLAAAELQLGKKGLFSTVGSVTGQQQLKPLTVTQTVNQVLGGNLDAGNPVTDKQWSDGTGRAFTPGSAEVVRYLEEQRKNQR